MRKKILILPSWYPSSASPAIGIFVQDQTQVLMQRYDVRVIVPWLTGGRQFLAAKVLRRSTGDVEGGIPVFREEILCPDKLPFSVKVRVYQVLAKIAYKKATRDWGVPDIIHAHVVFPAGYGAVSLGKTLGIPVVITEHTGPFSVYLDRSVQRRAVSQALARANRVLAVSPALREEINVEFPGVRVEVLGNVVLTGFFEPTNLPLCFDENSVTTFLCIALLNRGKGVDDLIRASRLLRVQGVSSFKVLIGGDGVDLPHLRRLAEELEVQGCCDFLGMLTRSEVRKWMQRADAFVLPSLGETFGLVAAEAMACGKPVIATRCGGPEFILTDDTGVLVDKANPYALADAMRKFIVDGNRFDSAIIRARVSERFGEQAFLQRISATYEDVLKVASVKGGGGA